MNDSSEIGRLLDEISKHNLLTAEEEILLGRSVQKAISIKTKDKSKLNAYEKITLRNAARAKNRMIEANLKLVYHATKGYHYANGKQASFFLDLFQEGCIGLAKAADKYDPERGYKFSTYAMWWIRQSIQRAYYSKVPMIYVPEWVCQKYTKIKTTIAEFKTQHGRPPTNQEISELVDLSVEKIKIILDHNYNVISLNQKANGKNGDECNELMDFIESPGEEDEQLVSELEKLRFCISSLEPQEQQIINSRYGLNGMEPQTLETLSKRHGVTRERIRQIQMKALNKIKFIARMHDRGWDTTPMFAKMNNVTQLRQANAESKRHLQLVAA